MKRKATEKQKARIKKLFAKVESVEQIQQLENKKFTKAERDYFNKVKGGKIRYLSAFRTSQGQFTKLSEQFIKRTIVPLYESQGVKVRRKSGNVPDLNDIGLKDFIRENIKDFTEAQETTVQPYFYNPQSIEKPLNNFTGGRIFINNGERKIQVSKAKAKEIIQKTQQKITEAGAVTFTFLAEFRNGFSELVLNIPKLKKGMGLEDIQELFEEMEGFLIVSERKK